MARNTVRVTPETVTPVDEAITEVQDLHTRMANLRSLISGKPSKSGTVITITAPCRHQQFRFAHNDYLEDCAGCNSDYGCDIRVCKDCGSQF